MQTPPSITMPAPDVPPGCPLTPKQWQILCLLAAGQTIAQAADTLGISRSTGRGRLQDARRNLGIDKNTVQTQSATYRAIATLAVEGWLPENLQRKLLTHTDSRDPTPNGHDPTTPNQRLYLQTFDQLLATRDPHKQAAIRKKLDHEYVGMCLERDVPDRRRREDHRRPYYPALDQLLAAVLS